MEINPPTGQIPELIHLELILEMVPSSPTDNVIKIVARMFS